MSKLKKWLRYWLLGEKTEDWGAGSALYDDWREGSIAMRAAIHAGRMAAAIHAQEIKLPEAAMLQQWLTPKLPPNQSRQDLPRGQNISDDQINSMLWIIDRIQQECSVPVKEMTTEERLLMESFTESRNLWERTAKQFNLPTPYMFGVDDTKKPPSFQELAVEKAMERQLRETEFTVSRNFVQEILDAKAKESARKFADEYDATFTRNQQASTLAVFMAQCLEVDLDITRENGIVQSITATFLLDVPRSATCEILQDIQNCHLGGISITGTWKLKDSPTMQIDGAAKIQSLQRSVDPASNILFTLEGFIQVSDTARNARLERFITGDS
jgi:hypothetical protein